MIVRPGRLVTVMLALVVCLGPPAVARGADAAAGAEVFRTKQCARCHVPRGQQGVGPALEELRRPQGEWELAGRFWNHVPSMFTGLTRDDVPWPALTPDEIANLMAYLQAAPAGDPPVDRLRGHDTLVRKGCLKCHAWRGEGARLAPELTDKRDAFASAPVWAARIWRHGPTMAALGVARGVLYPRFSGAEMVNLAGFLREAAPR